LEKKKDITEARTRRIPRHKGNRPGPGRKKLPIFKVRVPQMINTPRARNTSALLSTLFVIFPLHPEILAIPS
jgi:hypothetical protein